MKCLGERVPHSSSVASCISAASSINPAGNAWTTETAYIRLNTTAAVRAETTVTVVTLSVKTDFSLL